MSSQEYRWESSSNLGTYTLTRYGQSEAWRSGTPKESKLSKRSLSHPHWEQATVLDRVYAVLHMLESECEKRDEAAHDGEWLEGVHSGQQAEKRLLIKRLHWVLDPLSKAVLMIAPPLVKRLNERNVKGTPESGEGSV